MKQFLLSFLLLIFFCPKVYSLPKGFVYVDQIDPSIGLDLGFYTGKNFTGQPLRGYKVNRAVCTHAAAIALAKAQIEFRKHGYSIVILDAYRPIQAVKHLGEWVSAGPKKNVVSHGTAPKEKLLGTFIAKRSAHSRGSALDIELRIIKTNEKTDLGPETFGEESYTISKKITPHQQKMRLFIKKIMEKHGFKNYPKEWWHYSLVHEPFKDTYFDFPIE